MISSMPDNPVERIRHNLVGLRMPRALEALEGVIQQLERGQLAYSDDAARVFQPSSAHRSNLMPPTIPI